MINRKFECSECGRWLVVASTHYPDPDHVTVILEPCAYCRKQEYDRGFVEGDMSGRKRAEEGL